MEVAAERVVVISVRPRLLATTLGKILAGRGWRVEDGSPAPGVAVAAAVVSADSVLDLEALAPRVVLVLPDERGRGAEVRRPGRPREPFDPDEEMLGAVVDVLERGR